MTNLRSQLVAVDGGVLEVFRGGSGSPVVCGTHPHGSAADSSAWYADHTSFVYVMPRGFGRSTPVRSSSDLTFLQVARDLEAVRRAMGISRWVVVGGSAGCMVALLYALTFPDSLGALIRGYGFADGPRVLAEAGERSLSSGRHPSYRRDLDAVRDPVARREPPVLRSSDDAWVRARPGLWFLVHDDVPVMACPVHELTPQLKASFEQILSFDVSGRLAEIQVPTIVVCSRQDEFVPFEYCLAIPQGIANSEQLLLENSGHGSPSEQDLGLYHETILRFLARVAAS